MYYKLPQNLLDASTDSQILNHEMLGKSWIIPGLKLNRDASGGNTIHDGAPVLVGFISLTPTLSLKVHCLLNNPIRYVNVVGF